MQNYKKKATWQIILHIFYIQQHNKYTINHLIDAQSCVHKGKRYLLEFIAVKV